MRFSPSGSLWLFDTSSAFAFLDVLFSTENHDMINRRKFIELSALTAPLLSFKNAERLTPDNAPAQPIVISTWSTNIKANESAWEILGKGGRALDAAVQGVQVPEADPNDQSVGYGGLPDRDGRVTLDSCVMDENGQCGSVMGLEYIMHPVLVARLVMEKTPHVQLVGDGALQFALSQGFRKENLMTAESEKAWKEWLKTSKYDPMITVQERLQKIQIKENEPEPYPWPAPGMLNHDTIGMIALDAKGNAGGACTTSGMAYKMHGRVGDSPIIGAGLFVDNEVGAATATGVGEEVVKICGAHTIIEAMRRGASPADACKEAVRRIVKNNKNKKSGFQVGFLAINKKGQYGAFAVEKGFNYCVTKNGVTKVYDSANWM
ncbi:MAG: N(4)-(beta-N-acetylglucosaminyl)-L-asparaginase [Chitinophagaceae bacterium]|nr:N(4)-(beta-N-acetylglucosaminyl)-L-asparaginase [Chitinophagaceae bacterium]